MGEGCVSYTQAVVGHCHTVLLKSDGTAVACGDNRFGQCSIPALDGSSTRYVTSFEVYRPRKVLQASSDEAILRFSGLDGTTVCELERKAGESISGLQIRLTQELHTGRDAVDIIFPGGMLLSTMLM